MYHRSVSQFPSLLLTGIIFCFWATIFPERTLAQKIKGFFPGYLGTTDAQNVNFSRLTDVIYMTGFPDHGTGIASSKIYIDANGNMHVGDAGPIGALETGCKQNNVNLWLGIQDLWDGKANKDWYLPTIAANAGLRETFVSQITEYCTNNGMRGIDLDWEMPTKNDTQNFIELLSEMRTALNTLSKNTGKIYQISIDVSSYPYGGVPANVYQYVDYIHVMAYDGGDGINNSPETLMVKMLTDWHTAGSPYSKLVPAIPFYASDASGTKQPQGYGTLFPTSPPTAQVYETGADGYWFFNGKNIIDNKVKDALTDGCPGVAIWQLAQDRPQGATYTLLQAVYDAIHGSAPSGGQTCSAPPAPTATFGQADCGSVFDGSGLSLSFLNQGGSTFRAQVSQYPYGSNNIVWTAPCQNVTTPFSPSGLMPGMLYRWNLYAYGGNDCSSCPSPVSNTMYFGLPPVITASALSLPTNGSVTLSTQAQGPGAGSAVNYRWLRNGVTVSQGATQTSYLVNQAGSYTLVIDYSGSANCSGIRSTPTSNSLNITASGSASTMSSPPTGILQTNVTTATGPAVQLTVQGGSLGTGAQWMWYTGGCGGHLYASGTDNITVSPRVTTEFFVQAMGDSGPTGCAIAFVTTPCIPSVAASYLVIQPTHTPDGTQVEIKVVGGQLGTNAGWRLYSGACGANYLGNSTSGDFIVNPMATTTYFVRAEGCDTTACVSGTAVVCQPSTPPQSLSASVDNVLPGTPVTITQSGGTLGTNASWIVASGSCGGPVAATGTADAFTVTPYQTTTYYVEGSGDCNTTSCDTITIHVIPPPVISSITPTTAELGTQVEIRGTGFSNATVVTFGGAKPQSFVVVSPTHIQAIIDTGSTGDVTVTTPAGSGSFSGFVFRYSMPADNFNISTTAATCRDVADGKITITAHDTSQTYTVSLNSGGTPIKKSFRSSFQADNLAAGNYELCLGIKTHPDFSLCDSLRISQPPALAVYAAVNHDRTLTLKLSGAAIYYIFLNGQMTTTSDTVVRLGLKTGTNSLAVSTDRSCQGNYEKVFTVIKPYSPFPNPFQDVLHINIGDQKITNANFRVMDVTMGRTFFSEQLSQISGLVTLDLSALNHGLYDLQVSLDYIIYNFKIEKQ